MPAAGPERFAAGAGIRRAVAAGALALVTIVLAVGCGSNSGPSQTEEQASKSASQSAATPPADAGLPTRSKRRGHSEQDGSKQASQTRSGPRAATSPIPESSGKRVDYDVEQIVSGAMAQLGAGAPGASSRSLRGELTERLEDALAGIPPDSGGTGSSEGLAAAALRQLGVEP